MQRSSPILVYKHSTLLPPTSYLLSLHLPHPFIFLAVLLYLMLPLPPLNCSGFFWGMLEVFKPEALNLSTVSRFILWILSVSRSPTLFFTHLLLSECLDTLLCDLIALTSTLTFLLLMISISTVAKSFLSIRVYPSLNILPSLSLCLSLRLTPTLIL